MRPDLWDKPVCVLSNNDGCVVARSNEVKVMGVPMGVPYFEVRDILNRNGVTLFSGNFALYGDFSQRVVQMLRSYSPDIEVYSVDESFLEISSLSIKDFTEWGRGLSAQIFKWIGIPVSVGIAPTKTLAKAAADFAKKNPDQQGAYSIMDDEVKRINLLKWLPVSDVWGIGRRTAPKLNDRGIKNAYHLTQVNLAWARSQLSIRGVKTVIELRGEACHQLEDNNDDQKSITRSRSFGHTIRDYYELESAVATFTAQAAVKLREKHQLADSVLTFLYGSKYASGGSHLTTLLPPTNNTGPLLTAALQSLQKVYDPDFGYKKAGIVLGGLRPQSAWQLELGGDVSKLERNLKLMRAVDYINTKQGSRVVRHASEHLRRTNWFSRRQMRSPAYTTKWSDLPTINLTLKTSNKMGVALGGAASKKSFRGGPA